MYRRETAAAVDVAQELGIRNGQAGLMDRGTPLVAVAFIEPLLAVQIERTCSLIDALLALPLVAQDPLELRSSLQPCMDHLTCTVPHSSTTFAGPKPHA
jgi:hypothetical protein